MSRQGMLHQVVLPGQSADLQKSNIMPLGSVDLSGHCVEDREPRSTEYSIVVVFVGRLWAQLAALVQCSNAPE